MFKNELKNNLLIIGYYTINTPYEKEKDKLIESLKKFNYEFYIKGINNLGDWNLNTKYKAKFILECLLKYPNKKLLYLDVDAIVLKPLDFFVNFSADISMRVEDWKWRKNEYLSGTIYLESNQKTIDIVNEWIDLNEKTIHDSKQLEQWNLGIIIDKYKDTNKLIFKNLPPEYTYIFDLTKVKYPNLVPIIIHNQASRLNKNAVKTNINTVSEKKTFDITDSLFNNNELFSNSLSTEDKNTFLSSLQEKSIAIHKKLLVNKKPIINFVLFDHWGWVFSKIIDEYKKYATDFNIIPSVLPLENADVYQYFRPVHKTAKIFFNKLSTTSIYYTKGIHMIHDSVYDTKRNDMDHRIQTLSSFNTIHCTSNEQYTFLKNRNIDNVFYNPLAVNDEYELKKNINTGRKLNIGFNARDYSDNVKRKDLFRDIVLKLDKTKYRIIILSPNLKELVRYLRSLNYEVLTNENDYKDEFKSLFNKIDILLITSSFEGTPLPLIEGLKQGHTILSTKVGEAPIYLENGYLLSTATDYVNKINFIYNNRNVLENNRVENNKKVINLTWKNHVIKQINIWNRIIKQ